MYLVASVRLSVHPSVLYCNITPNSAKSTLALKLVWPTTLDVTLKFTKWGPKKSEDGANGDRVLFKYCILFQVRHDHKVWCSSDLVLVIYAW